jgi:beta-lactam-binding protein with PASTA domain
VKNGLVISQKPKPGTTLPAASPVNLTLSKDPRK